MDSSLYLLIAVLLLLFILLVWVIKKAAAMFKSSFLVLLLLIGLIGGVALTNAKTGLAATAGNALKSLFFPPVVKANSFLEAHFNFSFIAIKDHVLLSVPAISQYPELPRGCEVTSLAMLLNSAGVNVDKMVLAENIKRDNTPQTVRNGQIYFGNPNDGFVGSMYSFNQPGYGVYHEPIAELAESYLPGRIKDLTDSSFDELKLYLSNGSPVWVITNSTYKKLDNSQFETWTTPTGKVSITYNEHSVLLTGYDGQYVYFDDPLTGEKNKKAPIKDFEESWVQMGRQAISYLP